MANVIVSALATWNGKALKKGKQDLNAFDKQAKNLNKSLTRLFATGALVAFSKKAVNAFWLLVIDPVTVNNCWNAGRN